MSAKTVFMIISLITNSILGRGAATQYGAKSQYDGMGYGLQIIVSSPGSHLRMFGIKIFTEK